MHFGFFGIGLEAGVCRVLEDGDVHEEDEFAAAVVSRFAAEEVPEQWQVLEDRDATLAGVAGFLDITAEDDGFAVTDGERGLGVAGGGGGDLVLVDLDELAELADVLEYVENHQSVRGDVRDDFEADTDLDMVSATMKANHIEEPTAIDNLHKLKDAFQNEQGWVPVYYLFDAEGKLKTRAAGEYGITVLNTALEKMFAPTAAAAV